VSNSIWILDDTYGGIQQAAVARGFTIGCVTDVFKLVNRKYVNDYLMNLEKDRPKLVWVSLFTAGTPRGNRRDRMAAIALVRIVETQLTTGGMIVMEQRADCLTWDLQELSPLVRDKRLASVTIRWCNYGVRAGDAGPWSNNVSRVVSTPALQDAFDCACGNPAADHGRRIDGSSSVSRSMAVQFVTTTLERLQSGTRPEYNTTQTNTERIGATVPTQSLGPGARRGYPGEGPTPSRQVTFGDEEDPKRDAVIGAYPTEQRRKQKLAQATAG
jgi:hypothetical protein